MADTRFPSKGLAVPRGRLSRFVRFGSLAGGIAGGMIADGARQLARGQRPSVSDLLLTPANARKVTDQLANLRGAAMKIGQLMSMDGGDFLPAELTAILARLRADAQFMPRAQVQHVLDDGWGKGWEAQFTRFEFLPIAAASIGQVHRATTRDGRVLAIKVQYPGVRESINSDVDNVTTLLKLSGLVPKALDIAPMLAEAKRQLHEEADYVREANCLATFARLLSTSPEFTVPGLHADLTTRNILAMSFIESVPVETLTTTPQEERDRIVTLLIELLLRELFEFKMMQTDPNFANYRYDKVTGQLVLLDFGATRSFGDGVADGYQRLMQAGLSGNREDARAAILDIGLFDVMTPPQHQDAVMGMFDMAMEPLRAPGVFDFGDNDIALQMRDQGLAIAADRDFWHIPPMDTLFLQRKFGGVYLLATRLKARVDVRGLMERYAFSSAATTASSQTLRAGQGL